MLNFSRCDSSLGFLFFVGLSLQVLRWCITSLAFRTPLFGWRIHASLNQSFLEINKKKNKNLNKTTNETAAVVLWCQVFCILALNFVRNFISLITVNEPWVSKNGLAKNWREVHPHAEWFIINPLNTTNGYTHKPPLLYRFRIFYCSPYFWNQTVFGNEQLTNNNHGIVHIIHS